MNKLSEVPRIIIKQLSRPDNSSIKRTHKWMIIWGMMSMLGGPPYSPQNHNDWMILHRFQRRYLS